MLFNSLQFFIFFAILYIFYRICKHRFQNWLLLLGSYYFYSCWDYRFLSLILISTIVDYYCAIRIEESSSLKKRKLYLAISLITNLGILGCFKYFNFFSESLAVLFSQLNIPFNTSTLNIVLPVGISFYTFQTLSYTIDVYRRELNATRNLRDFALFVAFFPQLVAGPIERAKHLLPQITLPRSISKRFMKEGVFLIIWGLYLKMFIADNLAGFVDPVFSNPSLYPSQNIWLALYAFAFQIYCDFAGYSHIARGLGRVMGFDIMLNFNVPYFSTNPREFWHRWHISLSTWLKDYLYIPLGGNRFGSIKTYRNLFLVMVLGGLWHGAAWTFIIWGAIHGFLLITHRLLTHDKKMFPSFGYTTSKQKRDIATTHQTRFSLPNGIYHILKVLLFFHLICITWLFFRSSSWNEATILLTTIITSLRLPGFHLLMNIIPYLYILIWIDYLQYKHNSMFAVFRLKKRYQFVIYSMILICLSLSTVKINDANQYGQMAGPKQFIYFQF